MQKRKPSTWMRDNRKQAIGGRKRRTAIEQDRADKADISKWPKPTKRPR